MKLKWKYIVLFCICWRPVLFVLLIRFSVINQIIELIVVLRSGWGQPTTFRKFLTDLVIICGHNIQSAFSISLIVPERLNELSPYRKRKQDNSFFQGNCDLWERKNPENHAKIFLNTKSLLDDYLW